MCYRDETVSTMMRRLQTRWRLVLYRLWEIVFDKLSHRETPFSVPSSGKLDFRCYSSRFSFFSSLPLSMMTMCNLLCTVRQLFRKDSDDDPFDIERNDDDTDEGRDVLRAWCPDHLPFQCQLFLEEPSVFNISRQWKKREMTVSQGYFDVRLTLIDILTDLRCKVERLIRQGNRRDGSRPVSSSSLTWRRRSFSTSNRRWRLLPTLPAPEPLS